MKKLIAVLALCLAGQVWAFDVAGWAKAYKAKGHQTAFAIAKAGAEGGNADAQLITGDNYYFGKGVTKDYKQAVYWYTKAAEQGDDIAQYLLGFMYKRGRGVTKDYKQAVYWYTKAAEQGHARAQLLLGYQYYEGEGVPKNTETAYFWWLLADEWDVLDVNIEEQLTPEQQGRAQAKAAAWKPKQ